MKKRIIALLLAVIMLLSFASCGLLEKLIPAKPDPTDEPIPTATVAPNDPTPAPKPTKEPASHTPKPAKEVYDDSIIIEAYSEEGSYTDQWDNTYDYSFHLPQIDLDKPGAKSINEEIMAVAGSEIETALDSLKSDMGAGLLDVYWKSAWNGNVLSLLIECDYDWAFTDYFVYHYDCAEDKVLYNHDVLEMMGMPEEEFVMRARRTAELRFDDTNNFYLTEYAGQNGFDISFASTRNWTLDDYNIDSGLQIFPAETTMVIIPIGSMAGASYYMQMLELEPMPDQLTRYAFARFISAEIGNGYGKIVLEDVDDYDDDISYLENVCGVERGKEYYISGLYSEYTDASVAFLDDYFPVLFLTTVRGEVECVDIFTGLLDDCLCAFQLQGIGNINYTYFDEEDVNGLGYKCVAYAADGTNYDLSIPLIASKNARHDFYPDHFSSSYYDDLEDGTRSEFIRYLDLKDENYFEVSTLVVETGEMTTYNGFFQFLGCSEDGVVFSYYIFETEEDGAIAFRRVDSNYLVTSYGHGGHIFSTYEYGSALYVPTYG